MLFLAGMHTDANIHTRVLISADVTGTGVMNVT